MMYEKDCKKQTFIKITQSAFCFVTTSVIFFFLTKSLGIWGIDTHCRLIPISYRGADKSLARLGRKQATATEDFEFHISCL